MAFCTQEKATEIANSILVAHQVTPLSHARKCELISDELLEQGFTPKKSLVLMIVKLINLGWQNTVQRTKQQVSNFNNYRAMNDARPGNKKIPYWRYQERGE